MIDSWRLWKLIQGCADSISKYHEFLDASISPFEDEPLISTVQQIIRNERDNMEALISLYEANTKVKPNSEITGFARQALEEYRERSKLIK